MSTRNYFTSSWALGLMYSLIGADSKVNEYQIVFLIQKD